MSVKINADMTAKEVVMFIIEAAVAAFTWYDGLNAKVVKATF